MRRSCPLLFVFAATLAGCDRDATAPDIVGRARDVPLFSVVGPVRQVDAGGLNACAIGADGRVSCWGWDYYGQSSPPADLGIVTQISVGIEAHACAVKSDASLTCWGYNSHGQTDVPADLGPVTQVSVGGGHTCALKIDGTVSCWGSNGARQGEVPAGLDNVTQVSAGEYMTCVLKSDGTVVCWGSDYYGASSGAIGLDSVIEVSAGSEHVCALKRDGTVICWGYNDYGQATVPAGLSSVTQVSTGGIHSCAVKSDGTPVCWGFDSSGLGRVPAELGSVTQVSAGLMGTCFLKTSGTVFCWGDIDGGLVDEGGFIQVSPGGAHMCGVHTDGTVACWGNTLHDQTAVPAGLGDVAQISAGDWHTCAVTTAGTVDCWGHNVYGQTSVPAGLGTVMQVVAAGERTCALKSDRTVVCWGNAASQGRMPATLGNVTQLSLGSYHTCALKSDGTVICWGANNEGQATVPVGLGRVTQLSAGGFHTCALQDDATVTCWGANYSNSHCWESLGALRCWRTEYAGQATVPAGLGSVTDVSAGHYHTCALTSDGTVSCWGANDAGQSNVPAGLGSVRRLALYGWSTCGVLSDATVECWGAQKTFTVNTPAGTNVDVQPLDETTGSSTPILLTFSNVVAPGTTTANSTTVEAGSSPQGFRVVSPSHAFDIETTARFEGQVTVCVDYTDADFGDESVIRLLHGDGNGNWTDVTASLDTENNIICGVVTSFSPFLLAEENVAPVVTSIALPAHAIAVHTQTSISATFTDANAKDAHTATIDWGSATKSGAVEQGTNTVTGSHSYAQAGVYTVQVSVSDGELQRSSSSVLGDPAYIVVYDPAVGFVTGGGWFDSPASACRMICGGAAGRASFGFESRYHRGGTTPSGNIHFSVGTLRLSTTSHEWLVVSGARAQVKGEGSINGGGSYGFLITAIDGKLDGGDGRDRLRIRIWDRTRSKADPDYVVYDNEFGAAEASAAATVLGGGSINIHHR